MTVQKRLVDVFESAEQAPLQHANALNLAAHLDARDPEGLAHTDDLVGGQRARAHAALVPATVHLCLDSYARLAANIQRADALGAVALVRGQTHQIDRQCGQIDRHLAGGLRRIDVKNDAALATHRTDRWNVLNDTDLVIDEHDRHQDRVGAHRVLQPIQVEQSVVLHVKVGHLEALTLQFAHRVEHGFVLGLHCDQVLSARFVKLRGALDCQIVRLCSA